MGQLLVKSITVAGVKPLSTGLIGRLMLTDQLNFIWKHFYPRDAVLARVIAIVTCLSVCPSVRPSVRLSVTIRYCVKTTKASVMISSPSGNPTTLVFWCQISSQHSKGFPRAGPSNKGGVLKFSHFLALSVNIEKTVADTAKVTISD